VEDVPAIRFEKLSKTFGRGRKQVHAVQDLDLEIAPGQVFGFLGPNGAGKTTTIRLLMGLVHPTHGRAYLRGQDVHRQPEVLRGVGALVEGASFYDYLSARDNLALLDRTANQDQPRRREMLLAQVGLTERAGDRVGEYSTGMKQRLGIAAALLGDPELVILDEPTNGLDPGGIQEMRAFIRELAESQGRTVFLSSHLLNEVEQVCDRVAIIHQGRILRHGRVRELLAAGQAQLRIQASPLDRTIEVLSPYGPQNVGEGWISIQAGQDETPKVVQRLVEAGVSVFQVVARQQSLESFFMEVTRQGAPGPSTGCSGIPGERSFDG
jgi:ABC-2 type transport system ATP-binding protein